MKEIDILTRRIGVNFSDNGQATVCLWAPFATEAALVISTSHKRIQLKKEEFGYWSSKTDEIKPRDKYQFAIRKEGEEELLRPDPASVAVPDGVHEASQAIELRSFPWTDQQWKGIPLEDYIFYELHTGTFTPEGTFAAIEQKLDHLKALGITAIELMPVAQFPGSRNWGYDGVYPFAVQSSYGGTVALQHLVNACHEKGLAVVLDVVFNHVGPEGNYFDDSGPYFTEKYHTPWGNAINFDDDWSDGVRNYFIENVLMWFRDFHIDALRLDAVHAIKDFSALHILQEIKGYTERLSIKTGISYHLIVESDLNDPKYINPVQSGGYGMDAQWIDEFHHALRVSSGEARKGYYSDFNGISDLAKSYKDAYVYDGIYSPHRLKTFGAKAENNPGKQFVVFSQNHDQVGNRMSGERMSNLVSPELQKLMAAAVMFSPFLPMLFMGEEWGETNPFLYFVSHTDKALADLVRKGRKAEFASFHTDGSPPDPQDEKTFEQSKLQWNLLDEQLHQNRLNYYKTLIQIRRNNIALRNLDRKKISTEVFEDKQALIIHRWHEDQHILMLLNFSNESQELRISSDKPYWKRLINSSSEEWLGTGNSAEVVQGRQNITIAPESLLLYTNKHA